MARRAKTPSRALLIGAPLGGAVAVVIAQLLPYAGVTVTPELSGAITIICTTLVSYLLPGGRQGEGA
jgi:hypothetical protein